MKFRWLAILVCVFSLQGCVSTVIDTASSAAISVAKIPFKILGAVVSGVSGSEKKEDDKKDS